MTSKVKTLKSSKFYFKQGQSVLHWSSNLILHPFLDNPNRELNEIQPKNTLRMISPTFPLKWIRIKFYKIVINSENRGFDTR
jgi:hypothetical protein